MKPGTKQLTRVGWLLAAVLATVATDTRAQNPLTAQSIATHRVNPKATLLITGAAVFGDVGPDLAVDSTPVSIAVTARSDSTVQLLIRASGALTNTLDPANPTIPLSNLTWTSADPGFAAHSGQTLQPTDLTLAQWTVGGDYTGSVTLHLAPSWSYATGTYSTTLDVTLIAP